MQHHRAPVASRRPSRLLLAALLIALAGPETGCPGPVADDDTSAQADDDADDDVTDDDDTSNDDDDDTTSVADPYLEPDIFVDPHDLEPGGTATVRYRGALSDGDELTLRYGFNGWNEATGVGPFQTASDHGNTDFSMDQPMTAVPDGFEVVVDLPTDLRAMHMRFFRDDDGEPVWDDNDGWDYHGSAVFPYIGPLLTWDDGVEPHEGIVVTFETSVPCLGTVEYGMDPSLGNAAVGQEISTLHHISLAGLPADTTIHYRVLDSAGHQSEVFTFRTAPGDPTTVRFAAMADMQESGEDGSRWDDIAAQVYAEHGDLAFLLMPGDLPFDDEQGHWWTFFDQGRELFARVVSLPAPGNHDTPGIPHHPDTSRFRAYYPLAYPEDGAAHHRRDLGPVAVLALNSEVPEEFVPQGTQFTWVQEQLADIAAAGGPDWVFCSFHTPPYNAGGRLGEEQPDVRPVTALFDGRVDWVFTGHEHWYHRMVPLRFDGVPAPSGAHGTGQEDGVGYMVLPPAGHPPSTKVVDPADLHAPLRDLVAFPTIEDGDLNAASEIGFVVVSVSANAITLETWGMGTVDQPIPAHVREIVSYVK